MSSKTKPAAEKAETPAKGKKAAASEKSSAKPEKKAAPAGTKPAKSAEKPAAAAAPAKAEKPAAAAAPAKAVKPAAAAAPAKGAEKPAAAAAPAKAVKPAAAAAPAKVVKVVKVVKEAAAKPAAVKKKVEPVTKASSLKPTVKTNLPTGPIRKPIVDDGWVPEPEIPMNTFIKKQKARLLELKDSLVDSVTGMANETIRARAEGSDASAFGMHQADAGSDAYDRDFALSLLSKEQDALYEIEDALKRIEAGTYGICEMSNKKIPQMRLEALPFARFTVECQSEYEREVAANGGRRSVRSLFGLMDSDDDDEDEEEGGKETVEKSDD
jgi:RNA polymerase-binding transcription factor DksA